MNPLIGIALAKLPDLAARIGKGSGAAAQERAVSIIRDVLGTVDPALAESRLADTKLANELRIRLAEIEAGVESRRLDASEIAQQSEIARLRLELDATRRAMADTQDARAMLEKLTAHKSLFSWGPVIVSTVVTLGFFATLLYLIAEGLNQRLETDPVVMQVVNITVGALTAGFATVLSFWLGSSDGSRRKDMSVELVQTSTASAHRVHLEAAQNLADAQGRQTVALLERFVPFRDSDKPATEARKSSRQFHDCMDLILRHEGGFVTHPDDPGGATNMGITHKTLAGWRGEAVTAEDVRALTVDEAREIYRANYWNALSCDRLPAGIDLMVFDFGVNAGVSRSAKLLQEIVSVKADGMIGPITIGAAVQTDAAYMIEKFTEARLAYYRGLRNWQVFGRGWQRRSEETRAAALKMARGA